MYGIFIFRADVIGFAEYTDLAVANVKHIPFSASELTVLTVKLESFASLFRRVPSRSEI